MKAKMIVRENQQSSTLLYTGSSKFLTVLQPYEPVVANAVKAVASCLRYVLLYTTSFRERNYSRRCVRFERVQRAHHPFTSETE